MPVISRSVTEEGEEDEARDVYRKQHQRREEEEESATAGATSIPSL